MNKRSRIVHLFHDDKFIDTTIELFESLHPQQFEYIVVVDNHDHKLKYVRSRLVRPVVLEDSKDYEQFSGQLSEQADAIFFHSLDPRKRKILRKVSSNVLKVWFVWGFDLYQDWPHLNSKLFLKETQNFLNSTKTLKEKAIDRLKHSLTAYRSFVFMSRFKRQLGEVYPFKVLNDAYGDFYEDARAADIVVPVVPTEMKLIHKIGIAPTYAPFTYGSLEQWLDVDERISSDNILVGNSSSAANNHADVFLKLSQLDLEDRKVIVPLSYGDTKAYRDFVLRSGEKYLGDRFHPLTEFMPLDDYTRLIGTCGTAIFNNVRQQGVGNIVSMGYMGAKVFLNSRSPVYRYYKNIGLELFTVKALTQSAIDEQLSTSQSDNNRMILTKEYSIENVQDKIKILLETVDDKIVRSI